MHEYRERLLRADRRLASRIGRAGPDWLHFLLGWLSRVANHSVLWMGVAAVLAGGGGRIGRRAALRGMVSIAGASLLANGILKPTFPRDRPPARPGRASPIRRPTSSSFPSGHAASAAAFATGVSMEAPSAALPLGALAAAVGYSRVSNGVHYPTDVVAGWAIGALVAAGSTRAWPLVDPSPAEAPRVQPSPGADDDGAGLIVVANDVAGPRSNEGVVDEVRRALPACTIRSVQDPECLDDTLDRAAGEGSALGIIGGDGSVGAAVDAAIRHERPLAVFPGGTLNHFARDLGLDTATDTIEAIRADCCVEVDVGTMAGRCFVNTASLGSYPAFVRARERLEHRIGKWPASMLAAAGVLWRADPLEVDLDGERRRVWMIFIGNCAYDPPGFAPATRADLADGTFDVRLVEGSRPAARLRLIAALATGTLARSPVYHRAAVADLDVRVPGATSTALATDGEVFDGPAEFRVEKHPRRLRTYSAAPER